MARKMRKFSEGGAQGRYDRRMADIEKDFKKAMARKTGKDAEVAEAKRQQRIADAKDDLAKRTGADRTATRAAEAAAESNLTKTRKYGAPKAVSKLEPIASEKITETLSVPKMDASIGAKPAAKKSVARTPVKSKPSAADTARGKFFQDSLAKADFKKTAKMAEAPIAPSKFDKAAFAKLKTGRTAPATGGTLARGKPGAPLISGTDTRAFFTYGKAAAEKNAALKEGKAKGGKVKGKDEVMMDKKKKPMPKEPITGGANTVPLTPERKEFLKELAKRNAKPGMAKGGKATKFGAAMVKKSADTKGRAMVKKAGGGKCYASGGSVSSASKRADGCAVKGKTKGTMLARGGAASMRGRDHFGGAGYKKGGSC